ncbi:MAG: dioxygenase [Deltaproteobacteria bacterium]|nr:dioxygenase [Deltaproteobacteria bacterium]
MTAENERLTRREVVALASGSALAAVGLEANEASAAPKSPRLPVIYLPHGGGPWPFVDLGGLFARSETARLREYLEGLPASLGSKPSALLVVSAHWEEPVPTVMTAPRPSIFYDYYGFPPESYSIQWPAAGDPGLASRVRQLLQTHGFSTAEDKNRGFDHGTFIPLKVSFPQAEIPTIQLSLQQGLDPATHLALGSALAPLRDQGVLIVGSGMSFHNLRSFGRPAGTRAAATFDEWLRDSATTDPETRAKRLVGWASAPLARQAHPREEHLLPLMVVAGAARADKGRLEFSNEFGRAKISAFHFG